MSLIVSKKLFPQISYFIHCKIYAADKQYQDSLFLSMQYLCDLQRKRPEKYVA